MVLVWGSLATGNDGHTLVMVAINSLTMLVLYGVLGGFLLGVGKLPVPWQALLACRSEFTWHSPWSPDTFLASGSSRPKASSGSRKSFCLSDTGHDPALLMTLVSALLIQGRESFSRIR